MSAPELPRSWPWWAAGAAALILLWLLGPILTPFAVGAGLAYLGDPIVDRLQRWRLSRTAGVCVVFAALSLAGLLLCLLVLPMLYTQLAVLLGRIPDMLLWIQDTALPWLGLSLPAGVQLDADGLKQIVAQNWSRSGDLASAVWAHVSRSGTALLMAVANLLLVPIVSFYLLRDWDHLVRWVRDMIPPRRLPQVSGLAAETDQVLGSFIRGQLYVMTALAVFYSLGLALAGLDLALVIGIGAGMVSFIPYLGSILGIGAALLAMLLQTSEWLPLLWVALVFGAGQVLESAVLTPNLVGDKIGLHPVTVIFAVMAGGQLFGFVGVLLALPAAAVLAVLFRHAKQQWLQSRLYNG
ncbi:MAG: AI-2E family transporter [Gammaproteobacteria bacterium]|jgi:predicted PurR-regulated permease PerM